MRLDPPSLQYLRRSNLSFRAYTFKTSRYAPARGGGSTPYDGLYGKAPPERGIFFRLRVYETVGISLVKGH